jgi:signal transduction histidine kinase
MLRGYIEVFQEELGGQLNTELHDFMTKMEASANRLTAFVHNILNVARIDGDQLALHLTEAKWEDVLQQGASDQVLRAGVLGKEITFNVAPNLPTVAVDAVSMYEVINNLLDNAIKYSNEDETGKRIVVTSALDKEGNVETTVQDFGVGIPSSVVQNLFEKFYRNHRTRSNIGGTGLGLYLSKALVGAHGGQIWVKSKEGEGSTFGFTVQPFSKVAAEQKANPDGEITRQAHGWIKNHSLYKR